MIPEAAVPMIARNAAFLVLASKYPNSDLVYSVEFSQALQAAVEAAAPHIQARALEDAATELDDKRLLSKAFHIFYPEWLRERAAKLVTK